jgi:phosphoribosyl-ATP pyrophosphohydrolase/phosphoribosyl-AMP cyclohydrolase
LTLDCDADTLLAIVEQDGVACHEGTFTCFERDLHATKESSPLIELWETILARKEADASESYTAKLYSDPNLMLKKVAEEASEVIMAYKDGKRDEMVHELVDLLYHSMVVAGKAGITPDEVMAEIRKRRR